MKDDVPLRDRFAMVRTGGRARRPLPLPHRLAPLVGLVTSLFVTGCDEGGTGVGPVTSKSIGPEGGTIQVGGLALEIPQGALDEPQTITVQKSSKSPPEGVTALSPVYEFGPEGLKFRLPVKVTMAYDGGAEDAVIYWSNSEGGYDQSGRIDIEEKGAVTTQELHFSNGFVSHLSKYRDVTCDGSPRARQERANCKYTQGDICLDNTPAFPIQYVFVLMQENRSFDNYFGRFQAYLQNKGYTDARTKEGGVEVPATPYELRDAAGKAAEDQKLDLCSYDPKKDAPYNPARAGVSPGGACDKHYWRHAQNDGEQCVSDTCHEWWCSHLQVDGGRMDGFFQSNDDFWEGGTSDVGKPPPNKPADWYDYGKHPNQPDDGSLLRGDRAMLYYNEQDIPFYYWLADAFGLADHYHSSVIGPTFVNRDYLYGATSRGLTSNASDSYGGNQLIAYRYASGQTPDPETLFFTTGGGKFQPQIQIPLDTLYDAMDLRGVKYTQWVRNRLPGSPLVGKYGAWYGGISAVAPDLSKYTYSADELTGAKGLEYYVREENKALTNAIIEGADPVALKPQGHVFPVNFVDPDPQEDVNGEDEHPPGTPQMGQRLTYDLVRILMSNVEVWKRSVLFITWDEHGGFYDHVSPPKACPPDLVGPSYSGAYGGGDKTRYSDGAVAPREGSTEIDSSDKLYPGDFSQYGVRVPLLVISPWVKHQYVAHDTYDHTSIVRFIESRFGLPALTNRDANADPLFDLFDFGGVRKKLSGDAEKDPSCIACGAKWGTESIPDDPVFKGASEFTLLANGTCLTLFPPATKDQCSPVSCPVGKALYESYDWSRGDGPPEGVQCGGGGGGACGGGCEAIPCPLNQKWCGSECKCTQALECPPGDIILGGCECCAFPDSVDPLSCLICDSKQDVFDTYCPGG